MPHKVTLFVDARIVAEQTIPSDFLDTDNVSHKRLDVRLNPTEAAIEAGFLSGASQVIVTVVKV